MFQEKIWYFSFFFLICISCVASVPLDEAAAVSTKENLKLTPKLEDKNPPPKPEVKDQPPREAEPAKKPVPESVSSTPKDSKTVPAVIEPIKKFPFLELRSNKILVQKFSKTGILNETLVPFVKECDAFEEKSDEKTIELCPVFFDNLLKLNESLNSVEAVNFNASELSSFISKSSQNSQFCDLFKENVNGTAKYFNYTKTIETRFKTNLLGACYKSCFTKADDVPDISCIVIAYMGSKMKKTENLDALPDEKEETFPSDGKVSNESNFEEEKMEEEDEDLNVSNDKLKVGLEPEIKKPDPVQETAQIIQDPIGSFSNPMPVNGMEEPDPSSVRYFAFATLIVCVVYFGWHYRSKILGLILEGRRSQRGRGGSGGRGRKHTAAYRKLDSNLEEAINSSTSSRSNSQIIY